MQMQRSTSLLVFTCLLIPQFSARADSQSSKQTIQTIRELGRRDEKSLPALAHYLSFTNRDIRTEAVKAIIKIGTMRSIDPLLTAMRDMDSDIEIRAIDGIVNVYVPGYVTRASVTGVVTKGVRQVKSIFSDRNDTVVDPDVKVRPDIAAALSEKIVSGFGMDVRSDAALAAGILRAAGTVPALEQGLRSKNSDVIFECLIALQKIKDTSAGPSVTFLARDLDQRVQATALETLGVLHSVTSADDIRYAYKNAKNARIQRAALEALALLGNPADRPLFQQNAGVNDAELRASALEGLGRLKEPDDYPKVQAAFDDPSTDWRVHSAAAFAMVMEGNNSPEELSPLQYLVEGFSLRQRANVSLAYLTELAQNPDTRAALGKILPEALKERKIGIFNVLSNVHTADSIRITQAYAADRDKDVAFAAMRATRIAQNPQ